MERGVPFAYLDRPWESPLLPAWRNSHGAISTPKNKIDVSRVLGRSSSQRPFASTAAYSEFSPLPGFMTDT